MVFSKVGRGSEGGGGGGGEPQQTRSPGFQDTSHVTRNRSLPQTLQIGLCVARSRARWHLFKPFSLFEGQTHIKNQEVSGFK